MSCDGASGVTACVRVCARVRVWERGVLNRGSCLQAILRVDFHFFPRRPLTFSCPRSFHMKCISAADAQVEAYPAMLSGFPKRHEERKWWSGGVGYVFVGTWCTAGRRQLVALPRLFWSSIRTRTFTSPSQQVLRPHRVGSSRLRPALAIVA